jgi:hypothetical protein
MRFDILIYISEYVCHISSHRHSTLAPKHLGTAQRFPMMHRILLASIIALRCQAFSFYPMVRRHPPLSGRPPHYSGTAARRNEADASHRQRHTIFFKRNEQKQDEESELSEVSLKVRQMASFLSSAMLEKLLAAARNEEQNRAKRLEKSDKKSNVENSATSITDQSENDSVGSSPKPTAEPETKSSIKADDIPEINLQQSEATVENFTEIGMEANSILQQKRIETEVPKMLHKKEGDRNIALKDDFAPENDGDDNNSDDAAADAASADDSRIQVNPEVLQKVARFRNLIPTMPAAISKEFGRPLSVLQEHLPPLREPIIAATQKKMDSSSATAVLEKQAASVTTAKAATAPRKPVTVTGDAYSSTAASMMTAAKATMKARANTLATQNLPVSSPNKDISEQNLDLLLKSDAAITALDEDPYGE